MHRFLILGGDPRQLYLARILRQESHQVSLYYENTSPAFSLKEAMGDSHIILCPVPFTKDGITIFSHNKLEGLELETFLKLLDKGHVLFGGNVPAAVVERCHALSVPWFDFMKMEDVACKNAVVTAEGAVAEAISLSHINLRGSRCLVTGWGRCAQALAGTLKGMDAHVTIAGRDMKKTSHAYCWGLDVAVLEHLEGCIRKYNFIFNTVPAMVINASLAERMNPEAVVIDIASAPGGVDFDACRRCGVKAKLCPGLPGIYSPMTSARILCSAVLERL